VRLSVAGGAGSVTVLVTSPRVAPGLLSASAWALLHDADRVVTARSDDPVATALRAAGVQVDEVPDPQSLLAEAPSSRLVWVAPPGDDTWARWWAERLVGGPEAQVDVAVVHASYDLPGARLLDLVEVMDRLRTGCPWDREQTHQSLAPYLLEETYETLEALDSGSSEHLKEELGDLLLQVVFHARVASDAPDDPWDIDDVAGGIVEKLVRRHPHVFADTDATDAAAVEANWETIKATEKQRASVLDGIPVGLPALARADKLLGRLDRHALQPEEKDASATAVDQVGTELLEVVRRARAAGVDAEQALRQRLQRLEAAARTAESA
jgi:XTP/dITP diphosphohydrolase